MRTVVAIAALMLVVATAADAGRLRYPQIPPLPDPPVAKSNPPTKAKRDLGAEMFFDTRLSTSGFTSCDNCHVYNTQFQDNLVKPRPDTSQGTDFFTLQFNTESLLNIAYRRFFFRDGRTEDLGHAFTEPWIEDNQQLGKTRATAATHLATLLRARPGWVDRFRSAFDKDIRKIGDEDVFDLAGQALAVFSREIRTRPAPFDLWNQRRGTIPAAAVRGVALFTGKARCTSCHVGPNFTDNAFHNLSTSLPGPDGIRADEGRARVTGREADRGAFLTPTLRQVVLTEPYFHDGAGASISDVLNHLNDGAGADPNHDPLVGTPLGLTDAEKVDLYAFLQTLRSDSTIARGPHGPICNDAAVALLRARLPK